MNFKKLNLVPAMGMALALSLSFTSCIDNSESDGVSAMRQAQAELIKAKATTETAVGAAKAAYNNALAAVKLAEAEQQKALTAYQLLLNEAQVLSNSLQEAKDDAKKQKIEAELAVILLKQEKALLDAQNAIDKAQYENEQSLAEAKQDLAEALIGIEKRVAEKAVENPVLDAYVAKYSKLLSEINDLQNSIVGQTATIAQYKLYATGTIKDGGAKLIDEVAKKKTEIANDKADAVAIKARYEAVLTDLSTVDAEVVKAKDEIATLEVEVAKTDVSIEAQEVNVRTAAQTKSDARIAYDGNYYEISATNGKTGDMKPVSGDKTSAKFLMDEDLSAYNDAVDLALIIDGLEGNSSYKTIVGDDIFTELNYELQKNDIIAANGGKNEFRDTDYYQAIIDDTNSSAKQSDDAKLVIKFVKDVVVYYKAEIGGTTSAAGVEAFRVAYFTAKKAYLEAKDVYDIANDAYDAAVEVYSNIEATKVKDKNTIANLKAFIKTIEEGNEGDITKAISDAEDTIIAKDKELAILDIDITQWSSLVAVVEAQLAIDVAKKEVKQKEADAVKVLLDAELAK